MVAGKTNACERVGFRKRTIGGRLSRPGFVCGLGGRGVHQLLPAMRKQYCAEEQQARHCMKGRGAGKQAANIAVTSFHF
jgi:hypothetical protein